MTIRSLQNKFEQSKKKLDDKAVFQNANDIITFDIDSDSTKMEKRTV